MTDAGWILGSSAEWLRLPLVIPTSLEVEERSKGFRVQITFPSPEVKQSTENVTSALYSGRTCVVVWNKKNSSHVLRAYFVPTKFFTCFISFNPPTIPMWSCPSRTLGATHPLPHSQVWKLPWLIERSWSPHCHTISTSATDEGVHPTVPTDAEGPPHLHTRQTVQTHRSSAIPRGSQERANGKHSGEAQRS